MKTFFHSVDDPSIQKSGPIGFDAFGGDKFVRLDPIGDHPGISCVQGNEQFVKKFHRINFFFHFFAFK